MEEMERRNKKLKEYYSWFDIVRNDIYEAIRVSKTYDEFTDYLEDEYYEVRDMLVPFNLPISLDNIDAEEVIRLTKSDKKADADKIKFILIKKIGRAVIDTTVTDDEMRAALEEIDWSKKANE